MDLVEKWSAFLPHAEHISPTQFCAITLGDVREMIAEYQALQREIKALKGRLEWMHNYACEEGNCQLDGINCSMQPDYQP